ncbi:MAG: glycoside hydrolase family 16 protein, partial [Phaeodactylibacter sp.]|nr:glycoside hydrolase family 16 protein [Phaeodactylibacter sp.]
GNNELQAYKKGLENVRIEEGLLVIEAHRTEDSFTSARLVTRGKAPFKFGRIEVRAKLPSGRGTWPAIWMLPEADTYGGWPASGEIDIMEHVGYNPDTIFGTPHTKAFNHMIGTHRSGAIYLPDAETAFHTYAVEWNAQQIDWFVDDTLYHRFAPSARTSAEWPFDHPFYLILNLAVGGNWGGKEGIDDSIWPQQFLIDYVRVYTKKTQ